MDDQQLLRYSRHLLLPEIDIPGQEKLTHSSVFILGAGGLGSPAALYLAASGVGKLTICDQTTNTTNQIKAGKVKVYAVTSAKRVPSLPDVPTLQELGLKGFEVGIWHALYAPKGTPKPVIDRLVAALQEAVKDPVVNQRFADLGATAYPVERVNPAALAAHVKAEIDKWGPVIRKAGVYAD